jgi:hypothetical protein
MSLDTASVLTCAAAPPIQPFARLITHHFPLEQAREAFAVMESGQSGKVIFDVAERL